MPYIWRGMPSKAFMYTNKRCEGLKFKYTICANISFWISCRPSRKDGHYHNDISFRSSSTSLFVILHPSVVKLLPKWARNVIGLFFLAFGWQLFSIDLARIYSCYCISSILLKQRTNGLFTDRLCRIPPMFFPEAISRQWGARTGKEFSSTSSLSLAAKPAAQLSSRPSKTMFIDRCEIRVFLIVPLETCVYCIESSACIIWKWSTYILILESFQYLHLSYFHSFKCQLEGTP